MTANPKGRLVVASHTHSIDHACSSSAAPSTQRTEPLRLDLLYNRQPSFICPFRADFHLPTLSTIGVCLCLVTMPPTIDFTETTKDLEQFVIEIGTVESMMRNRLMELVRALEAQNKQDKAAKVQLEGMLQRVSARNRQLEREQEALVERYTQLDKHLKQAILTNEALFKERREWVLERDLLHRRLMTAIQYGQMSNANESSNNGVITAVVGNGTTTMSSSPNKNVALQKPAAQPDKFDLSLNNNNNTVIANSATVATIQLQQNLAKSLLSLGKVVPGATATKGDAVSAPPMASITNAKASEDKYEKDKGKDVKKFKQENAFASIRNDDGKDNGDEDNDQKMSGSSRRGSTGSSSSSSGSSISEKEEEHHNEVKAKKVPAGGHPVYCCPVEACQRTFRFPKHLDPPMQQDGTVSDQKPWSVQRFDVQIERVRKHMKRQHASLPENFWPAGFSNSYKKQRVMVCPKPDPHSCWYPCPIENCSDFFGFPKHLDPPLDPNSGNVSDAQTWNVQRFGEVMGQIRRHMGRKHSYLAFEEWPRPLRKQMAALMQVPPTMMMPLTRDYYYYTCPINPSSCRFKCCIPRRLNPPLDKNGKVTDTVAWDRYTLEDMTQKVKEHLQTVHPTVAKRDWPAAFQPKVHVSNDTETEASDHKDDDDDDDDKEEEESVASKASPEGEITRGVTVKEELECSEDMSILVV